MTVRNALLVGLLVFGLAGARAVAAQASAAPRSAFAVIIGNNHSLGGRRAELHYADDDAAKYFDIFRGIAATSPRLLASLDRDSERLYPDASAAAKPPTRAELMRVGSEIAEQIRAVTAAGGFAELYFIYAGHGDVDEGRGYIELADARFTSEDLEHWLQAIPFSRAHVILDSCNSFFMLAARKAGGRYYATSDDAARSLAERLPNVGVFLSTSAEGDAFEWSEIQSGVFSHIVRSGLLGAADANGDGSIDYTELGAFVATATAGVTNPNMRPHVFARGPNGSGDLAIVRLAERKGVRTLRLPPTASARSRVRDAEGIPLLDMHPAEGVSVTLSLPERWTAGATLERATPDEPLAVFALSDTDAALQLEEPTVIASRGPAEIFERLFSEPYGPAAVASYRVAQRSAGQRVFGVSHETAARMSLLLDEVHSAEHDNRLFAAIGLLGLGAFDGLITASQLATKSSRSRSDSGRAWEWLRLSGFSIGGALLGSGIRTLLTPSDGERLAAEYRAALGENQDYGRAFALADTKLHELAARESLGRWVAGIVAGVITGGGIATFTAGAVAKNISDRDRFDLYVFGGGGTLVGGIWLASSIVIQTPLQRLTTLWDRDPGLWQLRPSLSVGPGGASLSLHGRL